MVLLLDTHVLLWALNDPQRIPRRTADEIESPGNAAYFSSASIWEIAIKASYGRVSFAVSPDDIARGARDSGLIELPITSEHAARAASLPFHHRDPFDRLLVAQALLLPAHLLTVDSALLPYSELVRLI